MNRRNFLKIAGAAAAVVLLPISERKIVPADRVFIDDGTGFVPLETGDTYYLLMTNQTNPQMNGVYKATGVYSESQSLS